VQFAHTAVSVKEDCGFVELPVQLLRPGNGGGRFMGPVTIAYDAVSGTATVGEDFEATSGRLEFAGIGPEYGGPDDGEEVLTIRVPITDDDLVEEDEYFRVVLSEPSEGAKVGPAGECEVCIQDNDAYGEICFLSEIVSVKESEKLAVATVVRKNGQAGCVGCKFTTRDETAVAGSDYTAASGVLIFASGVTRMQIQVPIKDDGAYEKSERFRIAIFGAFGGAAIEAPGGGRQSVGPVEFPPEHADKAAGVHTDNSMVVDEKELSEKAAVCVVTIISDEVRRELIDLVAAELNVNVDTLRLAAASWQEQFSLAFEFEGDTMLSVEGLGYVLALPFKIACALIPPARIYNGKACFAASLVAIGLLTALIGDLASHAGCCLGLRPSVTAITFVALGTSLPDTFASKTAAESEDTADNAIGNITGSNSVNVFLGLGLPWFIASCYWSIPHPDVEERWHARYSSEPWYVEGMQPRFAVPAGDLGFSVGVFTFCALICLSTIVARRFVLGVELGGPAQAKMGTAALFVGLWFLYIGLSAASGE